MPHKKQCCCATDLDEQTLSFTSPDLSISNGNTVDLTPLLDNTDSQTLSTTVVGGETTSITISGGNTVPIVHPTQTGQTLSTTTRVILSEEYRGRSSTGTTVQHAVNSTMTRIGVGRWQVRFTGGTHPNGESYTPDLVVEEELNLRDGKDIQIIQGTQNANGFDIMITTGDNGGAADGLVDSPWSWGVEAPVTVITGVTLI